MRLRGLRRACFARLVSTIDGSADPGRVFRLANVHVMLEIVSREALLNIRRELEHSIIEGGHNLVRTGIAQPSGRISHALGHAPKSDNNLQFGETRS